ncbi:MAG TPA: glutaminase [Dokdonella sp.]|uniref:glutaminase n=1 Tax=Dokdonella sp. TaxID=2291710 RepID=UPI002CFB0C74|nr:glutaminase [Dokdonella sp.]HUD41039.1 glutaminase [Dokdonella sp.]
MARGGAGRSLRHGRGQARRRAAHDRLAREPFSILSVSKVRTLAPVLDAVGDALRERVGREPSGDRFDSPIELRVREGGSRLGAYVP